jgi:hypothetical protein
VREECAYRCLPPLPASRPRPTLASMGRRPTKHDAQTAAAELCAVTEIARALAPLSVEARRRVLAQLTAAPELAHAGLDGDADEGQ